MPAFGFAAKAPAWVWTGGVYGVCFISLALLLVAGVVVLQAFSAEAPGHAATVLDRSAG